MTECSGKSSATSGRYTPALEGQESADRAVDGGVQQYFRSAGDQRCPSKRAHDLSHVELKRKTAHEKTIGRQTSMSGPLADCPFRICCRFASSAKSHLRHGSITRRERGLRASPPIPLVSRKDISTKRDTASVSISIYLQLLFDLVRRSV